MNKTFFIFIGLLLISSTVFALPATTAIYRFNETQYDGTAGEVIDSSPNGYHGQATGANIQANQAGLLNNAMFHDNDAFTDYIQLPADASWDYDKNWTFTFWWKPTNAGDVWNVFGQLDNSNTVYMFSCWEVAGDMIFDLAGFVFSGGNYTTTDWYYFVFIWNTDNETLEVYVNGNFLNSYNLVGYSGKSNNVINVGGGFAGYQQGYLDEMVFLNDVNLSTTDINYLYNNGVGKEYQIFNPLILSVSPDVNTTINGRNKNFTFSAIVNSDTNFCNRQTYVNYSLQNDSNGSCSIVYNTGLDRNNQNVFVTFTPYNSDINVYGDSNTTGVLNIQYPSIQMMQWDFFVFLFLLGLGLIVVGFIGRIPILVMLGGMAFIFIGADMGSGIYFMGTLYLKETSLFVLFLSNLLFYGGIATLIGSILIIGGRMKG